MLPFLSLCQECPSFDQTLTLLLADQSHISHFRNWKRYRFAMTCAPFGQNTMYDLQSLSTTTLIGIYLDLQFKRNISDVHSLSLLSLLLLWRSQLNSLADYDCISHLYLQILSPCIVTIVISLRLHFVNHVFLTTALYEA